MPSAGMCHSHSHKASTSVVSLGYHALQQLRVVITIQSLPDDRRVGVDK